jgi:short-subunit dehydrogenase involved in D-alanine esterification of teichoic acids
MTKEEQVLIDRVLSGLMGHLELTSSILEFNKTILTKEQEIKLQEFIDSKVDVNKGVDLVKDMEKLEELLEQVDNEQD